MPLLLIYEKIYLWAQVQTFAMSTPTVSTQKIGFAFSIDLLAIAVAVFMAYTLSESNDANRVGFAYITMAILLVLFLKLLYAAVIAAQFLLARKFVPFMVMVTYLVLSGIVVYGILLFTMLLIGALGTTLDVS